MAKNQSRTDTLLVIESKANGEVNTIGKRKIVADVTIREREGVEVEVRDEHKRSESNRHRNDDNTGDDDDALFENVEEAKVLIARLERKKEARRKEY
eukprot:15215334-Ditylum_brightwellii.AAC.1